MMKTLKVLIIILIIIVVIAGLYFIFFNENNSDDITISEEESDCIAQEGSWIPKGESSEMFCSLPLSDRDKSCTDGSECISRKCYSDDSESDSGTCYPYEIPGGCYYWFTEGASERECVTTFFL